MPHRALQNEIKHLAHSVQRDHGQQATAMACLVYLTRGCLSNRASVVQANIQPLLDLQDQCVSFWLDAHEIPRAVVHDAIAALERAGTTAAYLASLPV